MSGVIVAPVQRDLAALATQLRDWFAAKLPEARDLEVAAIDYPRGAGQSHETLLLELAWNEGGAQQRGGFVVRCKPTSHTMYPDDLFAEQFQLMQLLGQDGRVRVARTRWFEDDPGLLGTPFFVMERAYGRVPVSVPPYAKDGWVADACPAQRRTMWESGVRQLAALQAVPVSAAPFLAGPEHARSGLAQEWDKFRRFAAWLQQDQPWPVLDAGLARLENQWPANQPEGLVWGDARIGNMMFGDDFEVVAVMDWEQPSLGGALHDLAWWLVLSESDARRP